jgi:O-antigen/teichoic acid export membrane protein
LFTIAFNIFFLTLCPWLLKNNPDSFVNFFYSAELGVGYVFISNLLASVITLVNVAARYFKSKIQFDKANPRQLLNYGFPILIVGIAGMLARELIKF